MAEEKREWYGGAATLTVLRLDDAFVQRRGLCATERPSRDRLGYSSISAVPDDE